MAPQSYQFVMRTGPNPGKSFPLTKDELSLGRDISNDIVINDAEVSRHHARIYRQAGGFVLEDTGSTNGTFVNGQRLMGPHMLRPGEMILLGENISLIFEAYQFDPDATIASGTVPDMPSYQQQPALPPLILHPNRLTGKRLPRSRRPPCRLTPALYPPAQKKNIRKKRRNATETGCISAAAARCWFYACW
jgi:predicted component of type VI protein secretion system